MQQPEIRKYLNASSYLQDVYLFRKAKDAGFSYEQWAKEMNASDKSYIRLMVIGKRPINETMINGFADNLRLSETDRKYLKILVEYSQSKTSEQREIFGKKLISLLKFELDQVDVHQHFEFLSNPLLPRLQVMLSFTDLNQSLQNLAWLLSSTEDEIRQALQKLQELKLIEQKDGKFVPAKKTFNVPDRFGDVGLEIFYRKSLEAAGDAIRLPASERRFKSLFLPLNETEFKEYLESQQDFVNHQLGRYNPDDYANRRLYQVQMNIIPVAQAKPADIDEY